MRGWSGIVVEKAHSEFESMVVLLPWEEIKSLYMYSRLMTWDAGVWLHRALYCWTFARVLSGSMGYWHRACILRPQGGVGLRFGGETTALEHERDAGENTLPRWRTRS